MFGFIKKLISGILAFISGLFAGKKADAEQSGAGKAVKKSSGYFLELDDAKSNGQLPAKTAAPTPAKTEAAPAKAESTPAPAQPAAKAEAVKAAPAKAEPVKAVSQSTNGSKPAIAAAPTPTATAAFASTATVPNTFGDRRRPGANMDYFLDMARQRQAKASS